MHSFAPVVDPPRPPAVDARAQAAYNSGRGLDQMTVTLDVPAGDNGVRLDLFLARDLPGRIDRTLSRATVRRLIMAGTVRMSGRPIRLPAYQLHARARVVVDVDIARLDASQPIDTGPHALAEDDVLFEDDDLIAMAKPAGLQMHPSADAARDDLVAAVKRLLAARHPGGNETAGAPYLGLHQRLDIDTSGVVLFTKAERANARLSVLFETHGVEKVYHAVVVCPARPLPSHWTCHAPVERVGTGRRTRVEVVRSGGQPAETAFLVIEALPGAALVEARPRTGRTHQIRAHLAHAQAPILGDEPYGAPLRLAGCVAPRVMLHATRLSLPHPVTGAPLTVECPYPPDFRRVLECLRHAVPSPPRAGPSR